MDVTVPMFLITEDLDTLEEELFREDFIGRINPGRGLVLSGSGTRERRGGLGASEVLKLKDIEGLRAWGNINKGCIGSWKFEDLEGTVEPRDVAVLVEVALDANEVSLLEGVKASTRVELALHLRLVV